MEHYDAINIYYKRYMAEIGGIETMTYNLAYKYRDKDVMFLFGGCHPGQLVRLLEVGANVVEYDMNKTYRCKRCFLSFDSNIPSNIIADDYVRIGHNNFEILTDLGFVMPEDADKTINYGVSREACESLEKILGKECEYCPNPYIDIDPKPLLKLVSPQRVSPEKGPDRIRMMAEELDKHHIPFQWTIITNDKQTVEDLGNDSIVYLKARLDIFPYVKDADYLVLLSNYEGSPMAPQEALMMGVPIIVTNLGWVKDLGIDERHGFFLNKDLSDLDVEEIYRKKGTFKFDWQPPEDIWKDLLLDGKSEKRKKPMELYRVKATKEAFERNILIPEAGGVPEEGQEFNIPESRIATLLGKNVFKAAFITVIGKVGPEEKPKKKRKKQTDQP